MVQSKATTVEGYLRELPEDRRAVVSAVRQVILDHLPAGYEETIACGKVPSRRQGLYPYRVGRTRNQFSARRVPGNRLTASRRIRSDQGFEPFPVQQAQELERGPAGMLLPDFPLPNR